MTKLTLDEARALVDSRFVDIENQIENIKNHQALWSTSECVRQAYILSDLVDEYTEAVNNVDDTEMEMEVEDAEKEYNKMFGEEN